MTHVPQNFKILAVDDNRVTRTIVQNALDNAGYNVMMADSGEAALAAIHKFGLPHLAVVDLNMPGMSGFELCDKVLEFSDLPIIMLTALKQQEAIIKGLEMGADDYLVKPVTNTELAARMKAVLRRSNNSVTDFNDQDKVIKESHLIINVDKREVKSRGKRINLTPTEFRLLATLAQNRGRVLSRNFLIKHVWGEEYLDQKQYLHVYINYLRNKIEDDPNQPRLIQNVRSVGYRFGM